MAIEVDPELVIPDSELDWKFTPSGGPGGQHANRSNTRVELTWNIAESEAGSTHRRRMLIEQLGPVVRIVADEHRSQSRNREEAAERLAERIRSASFHKRARRPTKPTKGSKRRRVEAKRRKSETKRLRGRPRHDD